jgi:hypothetical protein
VAVTLTGTADDIEIILVTQECLLTEGQRVEPPLPMATEGDQEECVRQWLENNGNATLLPFPFVQHPHSVHRYRWG